MDIVESCQSKLVHFRLKELKDVLTCVGHSKQGKKQDLMDRILALLYDEGTPGLFKRNTNGKEGLVEIINETYRKMLESGVGDSNTKKQCSSSGSKVQLKEETEESFRFDKIVRCPCGVTSPTDPVIQCADPDCRLWQHMPCVIISEKPVVDVPLPTQFFCEMCRVKRADPFWVNIAYSLYPAKLPVSTVLDDSHPVLYLKKTFQLTRADRDIVQEAEYDMQAWCVLLNDSVQFRMQWPHFPDLQVNGIPVRTTNRPSNLPLGPNGRDDGARITSYLVEGQNTVSLAGCDARAFCFGVRLVKRRTIQQVLSMVPRVSDGESFEDALARVRRCVGGGMTTGNEDSGSDLEVIADSITVNLRCPMSGSRMKTAGRFKPCAHMGCFDLETFIGLNERSRKWQCPICLKNYSLEDIIIDPYFNHIVTLMHKCGEEITEIDLKSDGSWHVKNAHKFKDLSQWHCPDGSTAVSSKIELENLSGNYNNPKEGMLSQMVDMNAGGHHDVTQFYQNHLDDQFENFDQKIITMSSSASGDDKDDEGISVNQNGDEQIFNGNRSSVELGAQFYGCRHGDMLQTFNAPAAKADIIILSDSEEDEVGLVCPEFLSTVFPGNDPKQPSSSLPPSSGPVGGSIVGSCFSNGNETNLPMPHLLFSSATPADSGFEYMVADSNSSDPVIGLECASITNSQPVSSCMVSPELNTNPVSQVHDSSVYNVAGDLSVDNHLVTASDNITLQKFTPSQCGSGTHLPLINGSHREDWISLRLGNNHHDGCSRNIEAHAESSDADGLGMRSQSSINEASFLTRADVESGSVLILNKKRSDGPFSFPRQPRSTRRRPNL